MFKKPHGIILLVLVATMSLLAACSNDSAGTSVPSGATGSYPIDKTTESQPKGTTQVPTDNPAKGNDLYLSEKDFVIQSSLGEIKLGSWDKDTDLQGILGKVRQEETKQLGEGADTFAGSYVKRQIYNGLELGLLSPKGNGITFFIDTIIVTGEQFSTARNIKVGDSRQKLMDAYYHVSSVPTGGHEKDILFYRFKDQGYNIIDFEVKGETIKSITLKTEHP